MWLIAQGDLYLGFYADGTEYWDTIRNAEKYDNEEDAKRDHALYGGNLYYSPTVIWTPHPRFVEEIRLLLNRSG